MRHIAAALLFAFLAVPVFAADTESYSFMDGLYSFEVPAGWLVQGDEENGTGVTIRPGEDTLAMLLVTTPNPLVEGELEGVAGAYVKGLLDSIGMGTFDSASDAEFQGRPAVLATFTVDDGTPAFEGFALAFDAKGYGVVFMALGPVDDQAFAAGVQHVLESYRLDEELLDENADALREIGAIALEEVGQLMN